LNEFDYYEWLVIVIEVKIMLNIEEECLLFLQVYKMMPSISIHLMKDVYYLTSNSSSESIQGLTVYIR
jgi:hypothetical protein